MAHSRCTRIVIELLQDACGRVVHTLLSLPEAGSVLVELPFNVGPAEAHVGYCFECCRGQIDVVLLTSHAAINDLHSDLFSTVFHSSRERNMTLYRGVGVAIDKPIPTDDRVVVARDNRFESATGIKYPAPRNKGTTNGIAVLRRRCTRPVII